MNLFQNVMILQGAKENFACAIFIFHIFIQSRGRGHLPAQSVPTPGNFPVSLRKMLMPRGLARGGGMALVELTDAFNSHTPYIRHRRFALWVGSDLDPDPLPSGILPVGKGPRE